MSNDTHTHMLVIANISIVPLSIDRPNTTHWQVPVPVSSAAAVASGSKVKKTGAAKTAEAAEEADPELAAVASAIHAMPASAMPKDGTQKPSKEIKMQQAAKSGGMKGLAGLFAKKNKDVHEAANGVEDKGKGKAAAPGPNTPAKTKA